MLNVQMMQTGSSDVLETEGTRQRGGPSFLGLHCVKEDMESFSLSHEDAQDMDHWRLKIKGETR